MIESGVKALRTAQLDALSKDVTYRRGGGETVVKAVPGRTIFRSTNDCGQWVRIETRDFIIPGKQLGIEPEPGDEIVFDSSVYEVLAPAGEPAWRWSDPFKTAMRIHTKHTGGEA